MRKQSLLYGDNKINVCVIMSKQSLLYRDNEINYALSRENDLCYIEITR